VVDTNCDPTEVDYVIPGNDDALRAIRLFASKIADSAAEGGQMMSDKQIADMTANAARAEEAAAEASAQSAAAKAAADLSEVDASGEEISMEDVLGSGVRKQPAAAKEEEPSETPQVETQAL
jgi:small subunit ribosomal protein S2